MESAQTRKYNLYNLPVIRQINSFIYSKLYIVLVALLTVIANAFGLDVEFFGFITFFAVYIAIFGKDLSPYLPMLCFCHITPSIKNNPAINAESFLFPKNSGYLLFYFGASIIIAMAIRFIFDDEIGFKNIFKQKRKQSLGIWLLALSFFISGIGSENYKSFALKNVAFSAVQLVAFFVPYFVLSFTVKWKDIKKDYLCFTGLMLGLAVGFELISVYVINGVMVDGSPVEELMFTGWGISNNIGSMISIMIPFAIYYVCISKRPLIPVLALDFLMLTTVFSLSRTAILTGLIFFIIGFIVILIKASKKAKLYFVFNLLILAVLVYGFAFLFTNAFIISFKNGIDSMPRRELYSLGIKTFLDKPILGKGFYSLNNQIDLTNNNWVWATELSFSSFFPGRWHNTIIQLLATGGVVSLVAYCFHRFQTIKTFIKKRSLETFITLLYMLALLFESLLDCHFFNVGPILFYSCALAFIEFRIPHFTEKIKFTSFEYDINENRLLK
jgi:O-antigen ligase